MAQGGFRESARVSLKRAGYAAAIAATLAFGLWRFAPTLDLGLAADDYMAVAVVEGSFAAPRSPLDAFNFAGGTAADVRATQRLGSVPWYAPPELRFAFLRPLSSALWLLDRELFGDALWAYHAHSIAVWALLALAASALYRRLLPLSAAALATAIFALDQSQHMPVLWLCNRGALYALLLGVLALHSHVRWREQGARWGPWATLLCTGLSLLFGEWALAMLAYVFAYEAVAQRGALRERALALLPTAVPAGLFMVARAWLGYGVRGSGTYVDPGAEPLQFLALLSHRIPVLIADALFDLPAAWWDHGSPLRDRILASELFSPTAWMALPDWRVYHGVLGGLAVVALVVAARLLARALPPAERRQLSWLTLGAVLALVPVAGSFPSTRLTLAAMFGFAPAFALALRELGRVLIRPGLRLSAFFGLYALAVTIVALQLISPLRGNVRGTVDGFVTTRQWVLHAELDPREVAGQRVFLLLSSEFVSTIFFAYTWGRHGRPLPRSVYSISMAPVAHDVERTGQNELVLRTLGGTFLSSAGEHMFRDPRIPLQPGDSVALDGMTITVLRLLDGEPQALHVRFDRPLEDPGYAFLVSTEQGLRRFELPAVGETRRMPLPAFPNWNEQQRAREQARIGTPPDTFAFDPVPPFVRWGQ
jgi:hypothetical protein